MMHLDGTINTGIKSTTSVSRPLRVLHLVETLEIGGTENQAVQTALRQAAAGYDVTVGCLRQEGPLLQALQEAGVPVREFRKTQQLLSIKGVLELFRLTCFLRRCRFDVLHCHDLMSNLLGVPAARLAGTRRIISSRRYLDLEWWSGWWRIRAVSLVYKLSHYVVVNSAAIRDLLAHRDGIRTEKIALLPNGIDIERFSTVKHRDPELSSLSGTSKIVVVANMYSPVKGHATLIKAAEQVHRDFPNVLFVLIGDGKERPKLEQKVRDAKLGRTIMFLGSRKDVPELLACCDISVLPSDSEGFPNALLEAMAAHLPVIATCVGGVSEVVDNEVTGLLVPPGDPAALSAAMLRLLKNQELRNGLAEAGHKRIAQRFSFERLISSLEALYTESAEECSTDRGLQQDRKATVVKIRLATHASE